MYEIDMKRLSASEIESLKKRYTELNVKVRDMIRRRRMYCPLDQMPDPEDVRSKPYAVWIAPRWRGRDLIRER